MTKTTQAQAVRGLDTQVEDLSSMSAGIEELATRAYRLAQIVKLTAVAAGRDIQPSEVDTSEVLYFVSEELEAAHCDFYKYINEAEKREKATRDFYAKAATQEGGAA